MCHYLLAMLIGAIFGGVVVLLKEGWEARKIKEYCPSCYRRRTKAEKRYCGDCKKEVCQQCTAHTDRLVVNQIVGVTRYCCKKCWPLREKRR